MGDTIKPRLEEAGADCNRVVFIDDADMGLTFIDDCLEKTIRSFQAKLLVLDSLQAFMPSNADMQNASHSVHICIQTTLPDIQTSFLPRGY